MSRWNVSSSTVAVVGLSAGVLTFTTQHHFVQLFVTPWQNGSAECARNCRRRNLTTTEVASVATPASRRNITLVAFICIGRNGKQPGHVARRFKLILNARTHILSTWSDGFNGHRNGHQRLKIYRPGPGREGQQASGYVVKQQKTWLQLGAGSEKPDNRLDGRITLVGEQHFWRELQNFTNSSTNPDFLGWNSNATVSLPLSTIIVLTSWWSTDVEQLALDAACCKDLNRTRVVFSCLLTSAETRISCWRITRSQLTTAFSFANLRPGNKISLSRFTQIMCSFTLQHWRQGLIRTVKVNVGQTFVSSIRNNRRLMGGKWSTFVTWAAILGDATEHGCMRSTAPGPKRRKRLCITSSRKVRDRLVFQLWYPSNNVVPGVFIAFKEIY
jgi:hypothetical protein